jgi:hypothetical protein
MKVSSDHKIQIFCAALSATIQADAKISVASGPNPGSKTGVPTAVEKAIQITEDAIAKLQGGKPWEDSY